MSVLAFILKNKGSTDKGAVLLPDSIVREGAARQKNRPAVFPLSSH